MRKWLRDAERQVAAVERAFPDRRVWPDPYASTSEWARGLALQERISRRRYARVGVRQWVRVGKRIRVRGELTR